MAITLGNAVSRTMKLLGNVDDNGDFGDFWAEDQVRDALEIALDQTIREYAERGGNALDQILLASTDAAGVLSLAAQRPLKIQSVSHVSGSSFTPVAAVVSRDVGTNVSQALSLKIRYVGQPDFPQTDDGYLIYGVDVSTTWASFDQMVCIKAAQHLKIDEDEQNGALDRQEEKLWASLISAGQVPRVYDFPMGSQTEHLIYQAVAKL